MVIAINKATYKGGYRIHFEFDDGVERLIDFGPFLRSARNPMTKKYLDKGLFQSFTLDHGDVQWNDFELCFPIWELYEGDIK
jgi:hypothetical protein